MWVIIELVFILAIILVSITEFFYPILAGKPLFGSFRKSTSAKNKKKDKDSMNDEDKKIKHKGS